MRPLPFDCPLGLSRSEAARYIGVSPATFDKLVADGTMPKPRCIRARRVWSRIELENAFGSLPGEDDQPEANDFDSVLQ